MRKIFKLQESEKWLVDPHWILNSRTLSGESVFKFAYQPNTKKLWLGHGKQNHKEIVNVKAIGTLNGLIRAIYFKNQGIIYLRNHPNKVWLSQTERMLIDSGLPKDYRVLSGYDAIEQMDDLLKGL